MINVRTMKNLLFALGVMFAVGACASVDRKFSDEEKKLIEGEGVMRVLKTDSEEDLAVLRMKSKEVSDEMTASEEFGVLCERMLATVMAPENDGVGIAAPQVGILRRLVAVQRFDKAGEPFEFYVNPEIVRYGSETPPGGEGCLSVPDLRGTVERAQEIDLRYRTLHGTDTVETVSGFTAVIFQHEIDHLDGVIYTDRACVVGNDNLETRVVGDGTKITWIQDNAEPRRMQMGLFPEASAELVDELGIQDGVPSSVSVFLLEKDGVRILFDAGNGGSAALLPDALKTLGLSHEDIDYVFITHLHGDHIGGLLDDSVSAFANAELYVSKAEYDGWMNMGDERNGMQRKLFEAYEGRVNLFEPSDELPGCVESVAAYGHTPGHTVFRCGDFLIVGDILHGAALQLADPEICAAFDMDKTEAVDSRKAILKYASENGLTICGMHFPPPAFYDLK